MGNQQTRLQALERTAPEPDTPTMIFNERAGVYYNATAPARAPGESAHDAVVRVLGAQHNGLYDELTGEDTRRYTLQDLQAFKAQGVKVLIIHYADVEAIWRAELGTDLPPRHEL
jgi:hypothetical protein